MDSYPISFYCKSNFNLDIIKNIEHYGSVENYEVNETRYCVNYGKDHVFYDDTGNISDDYEEEDLLKIPFKNPRFIMMVYTSKNLMKKILQQDNYLCDIYIDNDYGCILPIKEYIEIGMPI